MSVRCDQCGYDNSEHYRFCGRCGAMLHAPVTAPPAPPHRAAATESQVPPRQASHSPRPSSAPVTGPSFLGLSTEAQKPGLEYLLEDDEPPRNHSRMVIALVLLLAAGAVLAWHWRDQLTDYVESLRKAAPVVSVAPTATPSKTGGPALGTSAATGQAPSEPLAPTVTSVTPRRSPPPLPGPGEANMVASDTGNATSAIAPSVPGTNPAAVTKAAPKEKPATQDAPQDTAGSPTDSPRATKPAPKKALAENIAAPTAAAAKPVPAGSVDDRLVAEGQKYLYGDGVSPNCDRALKNFRTAAGHSNVHALSQLGTMYATGHCVTMELPTAYRWYARALHLDPGNDRIAQDLQVLWRQMNADQRQAAIKNQ